MPQSRCRSPLLRGQRSPVSAASICTGNRENALTLGIPSRRRGRIRWRRRKQPGRPVTAAARSIRAAAIVAAAPRSSDMTSTSSPRTADGWLCQGRNQVVTRSSPPKFAWQLAFCKLWMHRRRCQTLAPRLGQPCLRSLSGGCRSRISSRRRSQPLSRMGCINTERGEKFANAHAEATLIPRLESPAVGSASACLDRVQTKTDATIRAAGSIAGRDAALTHKR